MTTDAIALKYHQFDMEFLGKPVDQERTCSDEQGRYQHYEGGTIFWHPDTGAHEVHGCIRAKWEGLNWERGYLGYPLTDELSTPDGIGRYNHFQHGSIYWHPVTGAHEIHGAIRDEWSRRRWERSFLKYPKTDELTSPDGVRYNRFQGGYLVWTAQSGAKVFAEGQNKNRLDDILNFEKLDNTPYGNLREFYNRMKDWYCIDLQESIIRKGSNREKNISNWPFTDFTRNRELNGYPLSSGERFIITVAVILLLQWCLRDLKNNSSARRNQIEKYCGGCFKRNYDGEWLYNNWCSEFVSYVYRKSGNALKLLHSQSWICKNTRMTKKNDWCGRSAGALKKHFKSINRYYDIETVRQSGIPPQAGDFLRTSKHSMLILGFDEVNEQIYTIEGDAGTGATQSSGKGVRVKWVSLNNSSLVGIGRSPIYLTM